LGQDKALELAECGNIQNSKKGTCLQLFPLRTLLPMKRYAHFWSV